jgi:small subunit ribosomal protein S18
MPESTGQPQPERPDRGSGERRSGGGGDRGGSSRPRFGGDRGGDRGGGGGGMDRGGPRRFQRRFHRGKVCQFCVDKAIYIDYKDLERLSRHVSQHGKILPRRMTGTCSRHMRMLNSAIKRARMMALLPFTLH